MCIGQQTSSKIFFFNFFFLNSKNVTGQPKRARTAKFTVHTPSDVLGLLAMKLNTSEADKTRWMRASIALQALISFDNTFLSKMGAPLSLFLRLLRDTCVKLELNNCGKHIPTINPLGETPGAAHQALLLSGKRMQWEMARKGGFPSFDLYIARDLTGLKGKLNELKPEVAAFIPDEVSSKPLLTFMFAFAAKTKSMLVKGNTLDDISPRMLVGRLMHQQMSRAVCEMASILSYTLADMFRLEWLRRHPLNEQKIKKPKSVPLSDAAVSKFYPNDVAGESDVKKTSAKWLKWLCDESPHSAVLQKQLTVADWARIWLSALRLAEYCARCHWVRQRTAGYEVLGVWDKLIAKNNAVRFWRCVVWRALWLLQVQGAQKEDSVRAVHDDGIDETDTDEENERKMNMDEVKQAEHEADSAEALVDSADEPDADDDAPQQASVDNYAPVLVVPMDSLGYLASCDMLQEHKSMDTQMSRFAEKLRDPSGVMKAGWTTAGRHMFQGFVGNCALRGPACMALVWLFENNSEMFVATMKKVKWLTNEAPLPEQYASVALSNAYVAQWDSETAAKFPQRTPTNDEVRGAVDELAHNGFPWTTEEEVVGFLGTSMLDTYKPAKLLEYVAARPTGDSRFYEQVAAVMERWRARSKRRDRAARAATEDSANGPYPWGARKPSSAKSGKKPKNPKKVSAASSAAAADAEEDERAADSDGSDWDGVGASHSEVVAADSAAASASSVRRNPRRSSRRPEPVRLQFEYDENDFSARVSGSSAEEQASSEDDLDDVAYYQRVDRDDALMKSFLKSTLAFYESDDKSDETMVGHTTKARACLRKLCHKETEPKNQISEFMQAWAAVSQRYAKSRRFREVCLFFFFMNIVYFVG